MVYSVLCFVLFIGLSIGTLVILIDYHTMFKELDSYINNTKGLVNNWSYIVMYGFGATQGTITTPAYDGSLKSLEELSNAD